MLLSFATFTTPRVSSMGNCLLGLKVKAPLLKYKTCVVLIFLRLKKNKNNITYLHKKWKKLDQDFEKRWKKHFQSTHSQHKRGVISIKTLAKWLESQGFRHRLGEKSGLRAHLGKMRAVFVVGVRGA